MLNLRKKRFFREVWVEYSINKNHMWASASPRQRNLLRSLQNKRGLKLHLGCGSQRLAGWVNADAFPGGDLVLDLRRKLPFASGSAKYIFHEHFLEHLDYYLEVPQFLTECYRVLEPGGVMRVVVPDAERFARAYHERTLEWFRAVEPDRNFQTPGEGLAFNFQYQGQHHSAWDYETLAHVLTNNGFRQVVRSGYRDSPIPELNLEHASDIRAIHSLCVNATK